MFKCISGISKSSWMSPISLREMSFFPRYFYNVFQSLVYFRISQMFVGCLRHGFAGNTSGPVKTQVHLSDHSRLCPTWLIISMDSICMITQNVRLRKLKICLNLLHSCMIYYRIFNNDTYTYMNTIRFTMPCRLHCVGETHPLSCIHSTIKGSFCSQTGKFLLVLN